MQNCPLWLPSRVVMLSSGLHSVNAGIPASGMSRGRPESAQLGHIRLVSLLPQSAFTCPLSCPCNCCCVAINGPACDSAFTNSATQHCIWVFDCHSACTSQLQRSAGAGIFFGICCVINVVLWGLSGLLGFAVWGEVGLKPSSMSLCCQATQASSNARVPHNEQLHCSQPPTLPLVHAIPEADVLASCLAGCALSIYSNGANIFAIKFCIHEHEFLI